MSTNSRIALQFFVAICAASLLFSCSRSETKNENVVLPIEVGIITLKKQQFDLNVELPGRISPFEVAEIRPQVNGIIRKRLFDEGSIVTMGQQLYQIEPSLYQSAFNTASAQLAKSKATVKSAESLHRRYKELLKISAVSKQEYIDATSALAQARADVEIALAAQQTAQINLNYTKVYSPITGRIGKSSVTAGALVTANQTTPLAIVQQLDPVYIDVTQSSSDLLKLRQKISEGKLENVKNETSVSIVIDSLDAPYRTQGKLKFSDITVDQQTGNISIRAIISNPKNELLPGLFVRAIINQAQIKDALLIPQQSIVRSNDGKALAWVVDSQNKAQSVPVELGEAVADKWLVSKGLDDGQKVIVEGLIKIKPGAIVKPVDITNKNIEPSLNSKSMLPKQS